MIDFKNIEIRYGQHVAIHDLNLHVDQGDFFTFLGPSGCGKTTTLRALAGFQVPSAGQVIVDGEDITHKPIEKRGIGMVFQSYALFPTMTVRQNLQFGLIENKWSKSDASKRVDEVAKMVNLTEEQLAKNVSELSGGQQQRVAIARALAMKPDIIVLDEPLSNLDAKLRKQLRIELKRIQRETGATMVYVTHDQEEALTLSTQIAVFNNGYVEQVGTPQEIYYSPVNEYVCTFIGEANKLPTEVLRTITRDGQSAPVDPSVPSYVRSEALHLLGPSDQVPAGVLAMKGTFVESQFYGVTTQATVKVADTDLRCIQLADQGLAPGDACELWIAPDDLMVFPHEGAAA